MRHRQFTNPSSILLAGLLSLGLGAPVLADDTGTSGSGSAATNDEDSGPITDEHLQRFVVAVSEIREIRREYAPRLQQAESEEEQNQLLQQGRGEMIEAIEDTGLDPEEYNRIGRRIKNDEQLKRRAKEMVQEQSDG